MSTKLFTVQRFTAITLLGAANILLAYLTFKLVQVILVSDLIRPDAIVAVLAAAIWLPTACGLYGVARSRPWGRQLGLGVGLFWLVLGGVDLLRGSGFRWEEVAFAVGGGLLVLSLIGPAMARHYSSATSPVRSGARGSWKLHLMPWVVGLNVMFLPIATVLLHDNINYSAAHSGGWVEVALYTVVALVAAGGLLLALGKTVGLLMVVVADLSVLGLYLGTARFGVRADEIGFLAPVVVISCLALIAFVRPIWRFLART